MKNIIFGKYGFVGKNLKIDGYFPSKEECNLLNYDSILNYLSRFKGEEIKILNLAAKVAGAVYNKNHNVDMLYYNSIMSLNLIKAIKELNLDVYYLYISSVCCYEQSPVMSEDNFFSGLPSKNNFGYGISKKIGVSSLMALKADMPKFRYGVLIPTNMYGNFDEISEEYSHVIPAIYRKMLSSENIDIIGNANNTRNFLYVNDLCKIIDIFLDYEIEDIVNVCSDKSFTIYELVNFIKDSMNFNGKINFNFSEDQDHRKISNSKLKNILQKLNKEIFFTNISEGLKLSQDFYLKNLKH